VIRGWDININGSPIVRFEGTDPKYVFHTYENIGITFQDFIFASEDKLYTERESHISSKSFKNVLFISHEFYSTDTMTNTGSNVTFQGCTFDNDFTTIHDITNANIYDCVFVGEDVSITNINTLKMDNNTTNIPDFSDNLTNITTLEYSEINYNDMLIPIPFLVEFDDMVEKYTNMNLMYYMNFGLRKNNNPIVQNFRIDNKYNNGLFGNTRLSYGAYSFSGILPDFDEYPTSGHIGAFYFGGDYDNGDALINTSITLNVVGNNISIDSKNNSENIEIDIVVPDREKPFATGVMNFSIDFVSKQVYNEVFPKFCEATSPMGECETCNNPTTSDNDWELYNKQIVGGNPLVVDFSACANSLGEFSQYQPIAYKWWFDYDNYPDDFVTCSSPSATHTYCGGYLEEYNVKLCVDFK